MPRRAPSSLRARLILAIGAVVVITVVAVFAVVYRETDTQLNTQLNTQVESSSRQLSQALQASASSSGDAVLRRARSYIAAQPYTNAAILLFVIVPGHGTASNHPELVTKSDPDDGEPPSEQREENREAEHLRDLGPGLHTADGSDVGALRIDTQVRRLAGGLRVSIAAAEPLAGIHRALLGVARSFAVAGALALLLTVAFAYLIGSWVSAPLRAAAAVAARIDGGDLSPRLSPPTNTSRELLVLTDAFNHMLDRLTAAFDGQRDFVADASHELRTPITVIRGQLDLLAAASEDAETGHGDPVAPGELLRVERLIQAEIARIARLTDDLLLLAQAEQANFLHKQRLDIAPFITDLWDGLTLTAERRFETGGIPELRIDADPDRLAQALRNLGGNAINHTTPPEGLVHIAASCPRTDQLAIVISDDGPGIAPDQRERVFERFHRTDPGRSRARGGAGLGLSIVRAIIDAHGGSVRVIAPAYGGASIEILLPLQVPARRES